MRIRISQEGCNCLHPRLIIAKTATNFPLLIATSCLDEYHLYMLCRVASKLAFFLACGSALLALSSAAASAQPQEELLLSGSVSTLKEPIALSPSFYKLKPRIGRGSYVLGAGSVFPVALVEPLDCRHAAVGQKVEAMLLEPLVAGDLLIAPKGALVRGWVSGVGRERRSLASKFSGTKWGDANAFIELHFASLHPGDGSSISVDASPCPGTPVRAHMNANEIAVSRGGQIGLCYSGLKYGAASAAISASSIAAGPLGLVVGPALSATAGAADPSFAYQKPVAAPDEITRVKGFFRGAVMGLPGGSIVSGVVNKGETMEIAAGAELQVMLASDLVVSAGAASGQARASTDVRDEFSGICSGLQ